MRACALQVNSLPSTPPPPHPAHTHTTPTHLQQPDGSECLQGAVDEDQQVAVHLLASLLLAPGPVSIRLIGPAAAAHLHTAV
jgi:hypothetical protein